MSLVSVVVAGLWLVLEVASAWSFDPSRAAVTGSGRRVRAARRAWALSCALLAVTVLSLWLGVAARGVASDGLTAPRFTTSDVGHLAALAFGTAAVVAMLSVWHRFVLGPRALRARALRAGARETRALLVRARLLVCTALALGSAMVTTLAALALS